MLVGVYDVATEGAVGPRCLELHARGLQRFSLHYSSKPQCSHLTVHLEQMGLLFSEYDHLSSKKVCGEVFTKLSRP